jgi:hypothetical protein
MGTILGPECQVEAVADFHLADYLVSLFQRCSKTGKMNFQLIIPFGRSFSTQMSDRYALRSSTREVTSE